MRNHCAPSFVVVVALFSVAFASACVPPETTPGQNGENNRVRFTTPDHPTVLDGRILVGSRFDIVAQPISNEDNGAVLDGYYVSSDEDIVRIRVETPTAGEVELVAPGEAYLSVFNEGEEVDRILLSAARAASVDLVDGSYSEGTIDGALPEVFGLTVGDTLPVSLRIADRCTTTLNGAGDLTLVSEETTTVSVGGDAVAGFVLTAVAAGSTGVVATLLDGSTVAFGVDVVATDASESAATHVAGVVEQRAEMWARAYDADATEIVGIDYQWRASPRVTLSSTSGPWVYATVLPDVEGVDAGSAIVTATVDGIDAPLDLFAQTNADVVTRRIAVREPAVDEGSGCTDAGGCDPYLAIGLAALLLRRRWRALSIAAARARA